MLPKIAVAAEREREEDVPHVIKMRRGPAQMTTQCLQTTHTRHHTMLSPMRI